MTRSREKKLAMGSEPGASDSQWPKRRMPSTLVKLRPQRFVPFQFALLLVDLLIDDEANKLNCMRNEGSRSIEST